MAAGTDQAKQMREWIKGVERLGYVIESSKLLYKIRDPKTHGLVMTAPIFPKGNHVVRDTMQKGRRNGIEVIEEQQQRGGGQAPPPVWDEIPPEILRKQQEHEAAQAAREQEVTVTPTQALPPEQKKNPNLKGKQPATPEVREATTQVKESLLRILRSLGGLTPANKMFIWEYGVSVARENNESYWLAKTANNQEASVKSHMNRLLSGDLFALPRKDMHFWQQTILRYDEETPDAPKEEEVEVGIQEDTIAKLESDLKQAHIALHETNLRLEETQHRLEEANAIVAGTGNGPVTATIDDLFLTVVKRMLAPKFPNDTEAIDDALDFAAEVARRTSA